MKRTLSKDGKIIFDYAAGFIVWHPWDGTVRTHFYSDKTDCWALPNYTEEDYRYTDELGYGSDVQDMTVDHELAHTFLAEKEGLDCSPTLHVVAAKIFEFPMYHQLNEEAVVLGFQRYLKKGEIDKFLQEWLAKTNLNIEVLKDEFCALKNH